MKKLLPIALALLMVACAKTPTIQQGPDAEVTYDGLVRIDNSVFYNAWIDPDVDLSRYNKIMPGGAEFEFRAVKKSNTTTMTRVAKGSEFWISDENKEKFREIVTLAFREELLQSKNFEFANTRGADTLLIVGGLLDIVSRVPPDVVGREEIYLESVGEATLVIELKDSLTNETIYRAIDRRSAEQAGGYKTAHNTVRTTTEVRRLAKQWASRLREGLDSIHE